MSEKIEQLEGHTVSAGGAARRDASLKIACLREYIELQSGNVCGDVGLRLCKASVVRLSAWLPCLAGRLTDGSEIATKKGTTKNPTIGLSLDLCEDISPFLLCTSSSSTDTANVLPHRHEP